MSQDGIKPGFGKPPVGRMDPDSSPPSEEGPPPRREAGSIFDDLPRYGGIAKVEHHYQCGDCQEYLRTTKLRAFTAQTPVTRSALRRAIEDIRAAGVSISMDEIAEGAAGIAAPVFDRRGELLAGLVVGGPSKRLAADQERLGALVVERARELSRVMGFGAEPAS